MTHTPTGDATELDTPTDVAAGDKATAVRTVAFLADEHASGFLLSPTIEALIAKQQIQSVIIDLSTRTGVSIAHLLVSNPDIEYRIFDTEPLESTHEHQFDLGPVLAHSAGTVPFNAGDLSTIDANIVLVPAAAIDAGPGIDVSDGTLAGTVISQLQQTNRDCLLILPPESGLRKLEDDSYVRVTLKLQE